MHRQLMSQAPLLRLARPLPWSCSRFKYLGFGLLTVTGKHHFTSFVLLQQHISNCISYYFGMWRVTLVITVFNGDSGLLINSTPHLDKQDQHTVHATIFRQATTLLTSLSDGEDGTLGGAAAADGRKPAHAADEQTKNDKLVLPVSFCCRLSPVWGSPDCHVCAQCHQETYGAVFSAGNESSNARRLLRS